MKISLVIPVKNEAKNIERLLRSISRQTRIPDEVVLVNAGSMDRTEDIIRGYNDKRLAIRTVSLQGAYPGTARNVGVTSAAYDCIAFTDAGIELNDTWLEALTATMEKDPSIDVVYGNYTPRTDTFFKRCLAMAFVAPLRKVPGGSMRTRFIASSLMRRNVWREVGGFPDFRAAEDRIFMEKIDMKNFKVSRNQNAGLLWDIPENAGRTFRRFFSYSYHDLRAGKARDWHIPVLRMYCAGVVLAVLGFFVSPVFLFLLGAGLFFRIARRISSHRDERYFSLPLVGLYLFGTGFVILLIDAALFLGWGKYLSRGGKS
ncbi:MAG: glycosyltransferase [Candidatus Omnitrophota bacterium]